MSKLVGDHVPMPGCLVEAYLSRRNDLLEYCCKHVDDSMLDEIARADYGSRVEEHRAALDEIVFYADVQGIPEWTPKEVVELVRWSEPDDPEWKPGSTGERGHRMRSFCCATILLWGTIDDGGWFWGENQEIARLLVSSFDCDSMIRELLARYIVWRYATLEYFDETIFHAFALVCCAIIDEKELSDDEVAELCEWLVRIESISRENDRAENDEWMFGLTPYDTDFPKWKRGAERARVALDGSGGPGVARMVGLLDRVIGGGAG